VEKKYAMAVLIGVIILGGILAASMLLKKNRSMADEKSFVWLVEYDSNGSAMLVRGRKINTIKAELNKLIAALNRHEARSALSRPEIEGAPGAYLKLTLQKTEKPVAVVEITNEKYLTEKMGSSGAQDYLAAATYTLTENPGITTVEFVFHAGEHAMPGPYTREAFPNYKIVASGGR